MSRLDLLGIDQMPELKAAGAIDELASDIEDLLLYQEAEGIDAGTTTECNRAFRVLRRAAISYHGEGEHGLVYQAPDYRFKAKERK
jgi:hypothetical protein